MSFVGRSKLDLLRETVHAPGQFDVLSARYRRISADYAELANSALSVGAIWDGAGSGAVDEFWNKTMLLEQRRESVRTGDLGLMLDKIEAAGEDLEQVLDVVDGFAYDRGHDVAHARQAIRAELVRRYAVNGFSLLKNEAYGARGKKVAWDEKATQDAQKLLRIAVELDRDERKVLSPR